MASPALVDVGRVVRPHGLRGQVVAEIWTNRQERTVTGARLVAYGCPLRLRTAARLPGGGRWERWLLSLSGIDTLEAAEGLRGAVLRAEPLDVEGALWVHELIGADLYDTDGQRVGTVRAVEANPASDLLVLEDGRVVPLTFVARRPGGRLTVDGPAGLLEQ